jgi:TonB-linked SusC/RagA family outer membrane protein
MTKRVIYQRLWGFLCLLLLTTGTAFAQQPTTGAVKGFVKNDRGEPLPGVTVTVRNRNKSVNRNVTSDESGSFSFGNIPEGGPYSFTLSHVGYEERTVEGYNYHNGVPVSLSVKLTRVNQSLDEVVIVGYGTEKRGDLTGAVTQVGGAVLDDRPSPNISRGLEGVIPNLNIMITDGKPTRNPAYNVRGTTTVGIGGNAAALVLIDGVSGDPSLLNPEDIATVTVLKDAASAAIYGARGAFGVVLITTKSARKGRTQLNFTSDYSVNTMTVKPKIDNNGYDWANDYNNAYNAWYDYKTPPSTVNGMFTNTPANLDSLKLRQTDPSLPKVTVDPATGKYNYFGSTDWFQQLYRPNNPSSESALSLSGSNDNADIYISGRVYNQGGIFRYHPDNFTRYNLRLKGDVRLAPWFTLSDNMDFNTYNYSYPIDNNGDAVWKNMDASLDPLAVLTNPDGTLTPQSYSSVGDFYTGNNSTVTKQLYFRNTVSFNADLIKNLLNLKGDFTYAYTNNTLSGIYRPVTYSQGPGMTATTANNFLNQATGTTGYYATNLYAEAHKQYGRHSVKLLAGLNVEDNRFDSLYVQRDGIINPSQPNIGLLDGTNYTVNAGGNEWTIMGMFFRANYSYEDKYLVEINGRYDGSSKFPSYSRFGFFPSISAGWVVSKESFMDVTKGWLDNLKFRASVGSLGNGQINPYLFDPVMTVRKSTGISVGGINPTYTTNPNVLPTGLTWEKSTSVDEGVDATFFRNHLSVTFDYYDRYSSGNFTPGQPLPAVFGAAVPNGNNANLTTKGWEFAPKWSSQVTKDFGFSVGLSLSDNSAVITKFYNPNGVLPYPYNADPSTATFYKGEHIGEIWGFVTQGLFQSQQDITSHANQSYFVVSNSNIILPGDVKFADINHLGVINNGQNTLANHGDLKVIGNTTARYFFGVNLGATWKRLSIGAFFQGVGHQNWWPGIESGDFWGQYNRPYENVPAYMMKNVYSPTNPNAYFPLYRGYVALSGTRELAVTQTRYLQNAAYVRLKSLNISYNLPGHWYSAIKMTSAKIYFTGQNLFTLTPMHKYARNFDPEVISSEPETASSGNGYDYPMQKMYTFGINLTF